MMISLIFFKGVAVHYHGLPEQYRLLVQQYFFTKRLQIVIATQTLSLGVQMPCRTVVLCGESRFLNVTTYHQMRGRSGRRGFDNVGNVVLLGISQKMANFLKNGELPVLSGKFPLDVSLILRLLWLYKAPKSEMKLKSSQDIEKVKKGVASAIKRLTKIPLFLQGKEQDFQLTDYFFYGVEHLMRESLISPKFGSPNDLSLIVSHLFWSEPANLFIPSLLKSKVLHKICEDTKKTQTQILEELLLLLANLFFRKRVPNDFESSVKRVPKEFLVLPPLSKEVQKEIDEADERTLSRFKNFLQLKYAPSCKIIGTENKVIAELFSNALPPTFISPLAASSGISIGNISDLTQLIHFSPEAEEECVHSVPLEN